MGIANLVVGLLIISTIAVCWFRFGWNSFLGIGLAGAAIYSCPALLGMYAPIHISGGAFAEMRPASTTSVLIVVLIWLIFLTLVSILPVPKFAMTDGVVHANTLLRSCVFLSVLGFAVVAVKGGLFYFLEPRHEIQIGLFETLWRWLFVFGIVIAFMAKSWGYFCVFLAFMIVHFLSGDRTIPAISVASCLLAFFAASGNRNIRPNSTTILVITLLFVALIFGKPVYLFLKSPSIGLFSDLFSQDSILITLLSFEPFAIYSHLEIVLHNHPDADLASLILSIVGNLLVMPSLFGINTNYYNEVITAEMPSWISFGVAGNFFANAYLILGSLGVTLLAIIYVLALHILEKHTLKSRGLKKICLIMIAATIGIYAHRNGVDNLLSFVRQILIIGFIIFSVSKFQRILLPYKKITYSNK